MNLSDALRESQNIERWKELVAKLFVVMPLLARLSDDDDDKNKVENDIRTTECISERINVCLTAKWKQFVGIPSSLPFNDL